MTRILLVDDDESFRTMLRKTLIRSGFEVIEAGNGAEALQRLAEVTPALMLIDLIMPEKEGLETIESLRRSRPSLPIIAMSGGARINAGDFLKIARHLGACETLEKPFSFQELELAIDAALRNSANRSSAVTAR
jgi:DNA-binding response OmpR family regulator